MKIIKIILFFLLLFFMSNALSQNNNRFTNLKSNLDKLYSNGSLTDIKCNNQFLKKNASSQINFIKIGTEIYDANELVEQYYDAIELLDDDTRCKLLYAGYEIKTKLGGIVNTLGLPVDLIYLPFAISELELNYTDSYNGYGVWALQYIPAIKYGLDIDECYDERLDLYLSSNSSLCYLKYLYSLYNKWDYAITAFLYGPAQFNKIMNGKTNYEDINKDLPEIHRNIFYKFLAVTAWMKNYENMQDFDKSTNEPEKNDIVLVNSRMNFLQISEVLNIDDKKLKILNPSYSCNFINGTEKAKKIVLPHGYRDLFNANYDSILSYKREIYYPQKNSSEISPFIPGKDYEQVVHVVRSGDNLGNIAKRYGVKISELQYWNGIEGSNIYIDQRINLYLKKGTDPKIVNDIKNVTTISENSYDGYELHELYEVKKGDTFYNISKRYNWTNPEDIMKWNKISDPSKLQVGQKLKILKKK